MRNVEILAPAGSLEAMRAAFRAGADAAYIGGQMFGARAYAQSTDQEGILDALDEAHIHGKRVYLTVNTLLKQAEISGQLLSFVEPFYKKGIDAILVQDFGVLSMLHQAFPDLPLHASTQMNVCTPAYARWLSTLGIRRIVLPRELSLKEIRTMSADSGLETEVFVHGALCLCYSGQCLMSSMIGGRSGNRGRCAQPCRLPWKLKPQTGPGPGKDRSVKEEYLLCMKDLCTLSILPDLIDAGVSSLKIEGRMKSPEYSAMVSHIYRKYVDLYLEKGRDGYRIAEEDSLALLELFNRGGFTDGYSLRHNGPDMMSPASPGHAGARIGSFKSSGKERKQHLAITLERDLKAGDLIGLPDGRTWTSDRDYFAKETVSLPGKEGRQVKPGTPAMRLRSEALLDKARKNYVEGPSLKEKIHGFVKILKDMPVTMEAIYRDVHVSCQGSEAVPSRNRPLQPEEVRRCMEKTGQTPFVFDTVEIEMEEDCFVTVSALNALRRQTLQLLQDKILQKYHRESNLADYTIRNVTILDAAGQAETVEERGEETAGSGSFSLAALVCTKEQLIAVLEDPGIARIYLEDIYLTDKQVPDLADLVIESGRELWPAMTPILRAESADYMIRRARMYEKAGASGFLIRSLDTLFLLREEGVRLPCAGDFTIGCMNEEAAGVLGGQLSKICVSTELNRRELEGLSFPEQGEMLIYGRQPLMFTAQCLKKNSSGCDRIPGNLVLTDRYGVSFPVRCACQVCCNIIYNSVPLLLDEAAADLKRAGHCPGILRMQFLDETADQVRRVRQILSGKLSKEQISFTRGHYHRGVE